MLCVYGNHFTALPIRARMQRRRARPRVTGKYSDPVAKQVGSASDIVRWNTHYAPVEETKEALPTIDISDRRRLRLGERYKHFRT